MASEIVESLVTELHKFLQNAASAKKASLTKAKVVSNASSHYKIDEIKMKKDEYAKYSEEVDEASVKETCILSESTVCLLLDRFVPC